MKVVKPKQTKVVKDKSKDERYGWAVTRPYQTDPDYYKTWKEAQGRIIKDVTTWRDRWKVLGIADNTALCDDLIAWVESADPDQPMAVQGVLDAETKHKYRASLDRVDRLS